MTDLATTSSPVVEPIDPVAIDQAVQADPIASETVLDANPAAPSTVDIVDANEPQNLLDVVKAAVEKPAEAVASSDPKGDPVTPPADAEAPADAAAEDDADLPFHNHPRWKAVIAERDGLRDPAERYGAITGFMQEHGLSSEEVAEGYEVMALLKSNDPTKLSEARDWFASRLSALDGMLGHTMPDDLQQRIDDGLLDEDGAAELAQARAAVTLRDRQTTAQTEATTAADQQRQATEITTAIVTAVEGWEARIKASDPDYSKKSELVQAKCQAIVQLEGKAPANAAEATALADRALAEVNALLKSALPKPRAITPSPLGASTTIAAQPTTLRGAIDTALGS